MTTEMQYVDRAERGTLTPPVGERDHVTGPATAPVTLVEYGDFECASCRKAWPMVKELQRRLGKSLRFVFRNFPLTKLHPNAQHAAEAAEAAAGVNDDVLSGLKSGVNGTPTFFINGGRYDGPHGTEPLFEALQVASQS